MKIDILSLTLQTLNPNVLHLQRTLLRDLVIEHYGITDLPEQFQLTSLACEELARGLRQKGWKVYYWRAPDFSTYHLTRNVDVWRSTHIKSEGLIFGRYCSNLTAWLLANA